MSKKHRTIQPNKIHRWNIQVYANVSFVVMVFEEKLKHDFVTKVTGVH